MSTTQPTPSLSNQIDEMMSGMAAQAPADVLAPFAKLQAQLDAAGVPDAVPGPGEPMPDGSLIDVHGEPTSLERARAGKPAVVVFYRGAWCPYCSLVMRVYEQTLAGPLRERGVELIAVSPQTPDGSLSTTAANELSFTVLSDPGNSIGAQLGILGRQGDEVLASAKALGADIVAANADGTDTLPFPTVIVVDADGVIRWIDVHPNYATRSEPQDILDAVQARL